MFYVITTFLIFFSCVALHLTICRRRQKGNLLMKEFARIALCGFLVLVLGGFALIDRWGGVSTSLWLAPLKWTSALMYLLLIPTYIIFYANTELTSPSKQIMVLISQNQSMSFEELLKHFTTQEFIISRLDDLVQTKCMRKENGRYQLTFDGVKIARALRIFQSLLGRPMGG